MLERHWPAIGRDDPHAELPALGVLVKLEQDFVGSGLEVNRHAILIHLQGTGRELLEDLLTVHPDLLAVIDAEQKYGVDRLLGLFALLPLNADALPAVAALMKRYESSGLQLADAVLAYLAERENIRTVFTTDRRDFSIIRLKRNRVLKIIPEVQ